MFHYLPIYPAWLHDFFTTEGDNCRVTKMKAVLNKSGCKAGFEVGIGLCSPILTITKLYGSVLASILGPPSLKGINADF